MLLYKFKAVQNLAYALDIATNERLFCADYEELNDPFEGQFRTLTGTSNTGFNMQFGQGFGTQTRRIVFSDIATSKLSGPSRVCSLSSDWSDVRMWALYADSFRGMAFEFDVDPTASDLHQVTYSGEFPKLNTGPLSPAETIDALTHKTHHWDYEKEWRFIADSEHVHLPGRLTRILLGNRMPDHLRQCVLDAAPPNVKVQMVGLNPEGLNMAMGAEVPRLAP